ncbi:MAG: hypothetical protein R6U17_07125 [Thermoplasmata archaeon]
MKVKYARNRPKMLFNYLIWMIANKFPPGPTKNWFLRRTGAKIHPTAFISPDVLIDPVYPEMIHIGKNAFVGWGTKIYAHRIGLEPSGGIKKGKDFFFEENVTSPVKGLSWTIRRGPVHIYGFVGGECILEYCSTVHGVLGAVSYLRPHKVVKKNEYWCGTPAKLFKKLK